MADRLIAQGEDIPNPLALYNALNGKTVTQLFYITSEDISVIEALIKDLPLKAVRKTMTIHQVTLNGPSHIETRYLSCQKCLAGEHCSHYAIDADVCILAKRILLKQS